MQGERDVLILIILCTFCFMIFQKKAEKENFTLRLLVTFKKCIQDYIEIKERKSEMSPCCDLITFHYVK